MTAATSGYDEKTLLQQVAMGDEAAFSRLFVQYHHLLGHHIYRLTESRELTQEIVQDVFVKVWMIRESLIEVTHFRSWLFAISKNQALNALRHAARQRIRRQQWEKDISMGTQPDDPSPFLDLIDKAIDNLSPQQKKVYLLSRHEGMRYQDIADHLGLSHETVKYYMKLALAAITNYLREHTEIPVLLALIAYI